MADTTRTKDSSTSDAPMNIPEMTASLGLEVTSQRAKHHFKLVHDDPRLFMSSAIALLDRSDLVAAICGDKSALDEKREKHGKREMPMSGVSQDAYYHAYFRFAQEKGSLAVVRLFGQWAQAGRRSLDRKVDRKFHDHAGKANVLGLLVKEVPQHIKRVMEVPGFGVVLFRGSAMVTALLHWNGRGARFCWTITSDPLVTTILLDTWSELSRKAKEDANGKGESRWGRPLAAFRSRFGMATKRPAEP